MKFGIIETQATPNNIKLNKNIEKASMKKHETTTQITTIIIEVYGE